MNTNQKITYLPKEIAENVIKIDLIPAAGEQARSILAVLEGGFVIEHSHATKDIAQGKPSLSEIYIDLVDYAKNGNNHMQTIPEVAGDNSPTGKTVHQIAPSKKPIRVYLAIKKGQEKGAWQLMSKNLPQYLASLNCHCDLNPGSMDVVFTGQQREFVEINLRTNEISYTCCQHEKAQADVHEVFSLQQTQQKDLGTEMC